jgi:hypothetical protein
MKKYKTIIVFLLMLITAAVAQNTDYSKESGYFDFGKVPALANSEPTTEVYLEEPMLKIIAKMSETHDKGIGDAIGLLKLINVKEFKIDNTMKEKFEEAVDSFNKELQAKQWERIIRTKKKDETVNVYVKKESDGGFSGLVVMALRKNGSATFVNIVGKIDLAAISKISADLKIPGLDGTKKE